MINITSEGNLFTSFCNPVAGTASFQHFLRPLEETVLPPYHFLRPLEAAGTSEAQKCRGSDAPNPNRHSNQPLCHAVCAAAILFEVVAKI